MREKLIELLYEAKGIGIQHCVKTSCKKCEFIGTNKCVSTMEVNYLIANGVTVREKGEWRLLDECSNAGVYCSVCHKKVYKEHYANVRPKSKYCPNCGADMRGDNGA